MKSRYAPSRLWLAFRYLHTVFCIMRRRERFLLLPPLEPVALKQTILELGVSFIKMAQVLATRADFFSGPYLEQLRTIHDEVAPMPEAHFERVFRTAFGHSPPFASFERTPMASASIGQVHRATLPPGRLVAVKLRRLHITRQVSADIRIVRAMLGLFRPLFSEYTKNSLDAVINEFNAMILKEVDLGQELEHLRTFRERYADSGVRFPRPLAELCSRDALVMDFEEGVRIDAVERLEQMGVNFSDVMEKLVVFYTEQMLVQGYFHCDPHPGNLLVRADGGLSLLDFGMVKRLPKRTRVAMIELVKAAHEQDFELFIVACKRLGVIAANAPEEQMQEFAERMFSIFADQSLSAASMQALAFQVLDSMKELPFKLPQEVVFVMRASTLIEGLGTRYIENFNGVKDILPILRHNLPRALGSEAGLFPTLKGEIKDLPLSLRRAKSLLIDLSEHNLHVKLAPETMDQLREELRALVSRLVPGVLCIAAGFFLALLDFPLHKPVGAGLFLAGTVWILWRRK